MNIPMRTAIPLIGIGSMITTITGYWSYNLYSCHLRSLSKDWTDHVEYENTGLREMVPQSLWQVTASYMTMKDYRNMTIYKLPSGGLFIHSPIALPDQVMSEIEKLGRPEVVMVPNVSRASLVDAAVYKDRYPQLTMICPSQIMEKLKERAIPLTMSAEDFSSSIKDMKIIEPPLIRLQELVLDVPLVDGTRALLFGELLSNLAFFPGLLGKLFVVTNMAGDGIQPQFPMTHQVFGFAKSKDSSKFFHELYRKMKEAEKNTSSIVEKNNPPPPPGSYAWMTFQHGPPSSSRCVRRIQKIAQFIDYKSSI